MLTSRCRVFQAALAFIALTLPLGAFAEEGAESQEGKALYSIGGGDELKKVSADTGGSFSRTKSAIDPSESYSSPYSSYQRARKLSHRDYKERSVTRKRKQNARTIKNIKKSHKRAEKADREYYNRNCGMASGSSRWCHRVERRIKEKKRSRKRQLKETRRYLRRR